MPITKISLTQADVDLLTKAANGDEAAKAAVQETLFDNADTPFPELISDLRDNTYADDVEVRPEIVDGSLCLRIVATYDIEETVDVSVEEFIDETPKALLKDYSKTVDQFYNDCDAIVDKHVITWPELFAETDVTDIKGDVDEPADVDGNTTYHAPYYEEDTGYGEPEGDFYDGPVTATGTVDFFAIVKLVVPKGDL